MKGVLDTSVVIAREVEELPDEVAISTVTLAELHFGMHLAKDDEQRAFRLRRLAEIESRFQTLPVDDEVARAYGELAGLTARSGRKVRSRAMDLLIAATARAYRLPLYTRNRQDFEPLAEFVEIMVV